MRGLGLGLGLTKATSGGASPPAELLSGAGSGTGWTANGGGSYTHTAGTTTGLNWTGAGLNGGSSLTTGATYRTVFTLSAVTAGSVRVSFFGNGTTTSGTFRSAAGTYTEDLVIVSPNTSFGMSPGSPFDGTCSAISVTRIS